MKIYSILIYSAICSCYQNTQAQNSLKSSISFGCNLASISGSDAYISNQMIRSSPYAGVGFIFGYNRIVFGEFAANNNTLKNTRSFAEVGVKLNYNRYGYLSTIVFPDGISENIAKMRIINLNLEQSYNYQLTKTIITKITLKEGYRHNFIYGDTTPFNYLYDLMTVNQKLNLRNYNLDIGINALFKIAPKFYFNLGYSHGLLNIHKSNTDKNMKEFYLTAKITKYY